MLFIPNPAGILIEAASEGMQYAMGERAEQIAAAARTIAPYDPTSDGPHYRDQIGVDVGVEDGLATGRVHADDEAAGYIEFGTVDTPTFAPLRRAAESGL